MQPTLRYLQTGAGMMSFMTRDRKPISPATTSRCPSTSSPRTQTSMEREARSLHSGMITSVNLTSLPKSRMTNLRAPGVQCVNQILYVHIKLLQTIKYYVFTSNYCKHSNIMCSHKTVYCNMATSHAMYSNLRNKQM